MMTAAAERFGITISAIDKSREGFASVLAGARRLGGSLSRVLTAPLRMIANPASMAAVFNVKAIADAVGGLYEAADKQRLAEAKLGAILRSTGYAAGIAGESIKKYASERQKLTTFGDEETIDAAAIMATFKDVRGKAFFEAMTAAQDLSAALGGDLQSSVLQIGKALNAPIEGVSALQRVGVSFSASQKEQIKNFVETNQVAKAQALILGELKSEFGGVAEAIASGAGGKIKQLKNLLGDMVEDLAAVFEPAVIAVVEFVEAGATRVKAFLERAREYVANNFDTFLTMFRTGLQGLASVMGGYYSALGRTFSGVFNSGDMLKSMTSFVAKVPLYIAKVSIWVRRLASDIVEVLMKAFSRIAFGFGDIIRTLPAILGIFNPEEAAAKFDTLGAEFHSLSIQSYMMFGNLNKDSKEVAEGLKAIDEEAKKLNSELSKKLIAQRAEDQAKAVRGYFRGVWSSIENAVVGPFNQSVKRANERAIASAKFAAQLWQEAFRNASQAIDRATEGLRQAIGERNRFDVDKVGERLQHDLARFDARRDVMAQQGFNVQGAEWNRAQMQIAALRQYKEEADKVQFDPDRRRQFEEAGGRLAGDLRNNPSVIMDKRMAREVEAIWQHFKGIQERQVQRNVEAARQEQKFAERRQNEARDGMAKARNAEIGQLEATVNGLKKLEAAASSAAQKLGGGLQQANKVLPMPGIAAFNGIDMALDALLGKL